VTVVQAVAAAAAVARRGKDQDKNLILKKGPTAANLTARIARDRPDVLERIESQGPFTERFRISWEKRVGR